MTAFVGPILFALFVWWFSTGAIIYLDGLPRPTFKWSMLGATALLGLAFYGLYASADDTTTSGAYMAFASALIAWGWHEISFYMGYVTGPRKHACEEGCSGLPHLGHADEHLPHRLIVHPVHLGPNAPHLRLQRDLRAGGLQEDQGHESAL